LRGREGSIEHVFLLGCASRSGRWAWGGHRPYLCLPYGAHRPNLCFPWVGHRPNLCFLCCSAGRGALPDRTGPSLGRKGEAARPPPQLIPHGLFLALDAGRASPRGPGLQRTLCSSVYCVASQMLTPGDEALSGEGARDLIHSDGDDPRDPPHVMTRRSPSRMVPSTPMYHPLTQWRDSDILLR